MLSGKLSSRSAEEVKVYIHPKSNVCGMLVEDGKYYIVLETAFRDPNPDCEWSNEKLLHVANLSEQIGSQLITTKKDGPNVKYVGEKGEIVVKVLSFRSNENKLFALREVNINRLLQEDGENNHIAKFYGMVEKDGNIYLVFKRITSTLSQCFFRHSFTLVSAYTLISFLLHLFCSLVLFKLFTSTCVFSFHFSWIGLRCLSKF